MAFNFGTMGDDTIVVPAHDDTGIAATSGAPVDGAVEAGESGGGSVVGTAPWLSRPAGLAKCFQFEC